MRFTAGQRLHQAAKDPKFECPELGQTLKRKKNNEEKRKEKRERKGPSRVTSVEWEKNV